MSYTKPTIETIERRFKHTFATLALLDRGPPAEDWTKDYARQLLAEAEEKINEGDKTNDAEALWSAVTDALAKRIENEGDIYRGWRETGEAKAALAFLEAAFAFDCTIILVD